LIISGRKGTSSKWRSTQTTCFSNCSREIVFRRKVLCSKRVCHHIEQS